MRANMLHTISLCGLLSASVAAHDSLPRSFNCKFDGVALTSLEMAARLERSIGLRLIGQPPVRGNLSIATEEDMACLYVAGWRERPVEGNNLSSETYCYANASEVFACQVVSKRRALDNVYEFSNMECNNSDLDQLALSGNGDAILSRFAPITSLQAGQSRDFYLGSGSCEIIR